jgi:hypothetical protein
VNEVLKLRQEAGYSGLRTGKAMVAMVRCATLEGLVDVDLTAAPPAITGGRCCRSAWRL